MIVFAPQFWLPGEQKLDVLQTSVDQFRGGGPEEGEERGWEGGGGGREREREREER